jgi:PTS system nitrogen regulatory IIA component
MQLNIREVARIFEVPENRVDLWIGNHALPYHIVAGERLFNRAELLEWATTHRIKFSQDLYEVWASNVARFSDALEFGGIADRVPGSDVATVLTNIVAGLPLPPEFDREGLIQLLLAREATGTTAVGDGIAIPHTRHPMIVPVERPILRICYLAEPLDFGAPDRAPVHTLFVLLSPTIRSHLRLLSSIAQALRDDVFRTAVRRRLGLEALVARARQLDGAGRPEQAEGSPDSQEKAK